MKHFIDENYQRNTLYRKTGPAEAALAAGTLPVWTTHMSKMQKLHHAHALLSV